MFFAALFTIDKICYLVAQSCPIPLRPRGLEHVRHLCPWGFLGTVTALGCHFLLQRIFLTQGSNLCLHVSCTAGRFFTAVPPGKPTPRDGNNLSIHHIHICVYIHKHMCVYTHKHMCVCVYMYICIHKIEYYSSVNKSEHLVICDNIDGF